MSVDFRGFPACTCQAAWLPVFERELQRRDIIDGPLSIAQLIGGFSGSGGTHSTGGASDLWLTGERAEDAVWVARQMGADPTWHRLAGWDTGNTGSEHVHSVLRGCPHLSSSAQAQVGAVDANGDGLGGTSTPDPGPRPLSGRTWQQGIEWQRQQEDDMPAPKDWDAEDWAAVRSNVVPQIAAAVWAFVVRKEVKRRDGSIATTEQTAQAALKKAANG
jgi:hypothetical protein